MNPRHSSPKDQTIEDQKSEVWIRFSEITRQLKELFESEPIDRISKIEWIETPIELNSPRFGATEQMDSQNKIVLQLSEELLGAQPYLLEPVLWREAFLTHLSRRIRMVPEAGDLGLFCYLKYGIRGQKVRHRFKQIWETVSPPKEYEFFRYHPSAGFPYFDKVTDGNFLQIVKSWLNEINNINIPLKSVTFTSALERLMINYHRILKPIELKVLKFINDHPTRSQKEIGDNLGLRQSTVSRTLKILAEKHLLRFRYFINLPLIGLQPIAVQFQIPKMKQLYTFQRIIFQIRYAHSIQEFNNFLSIIFAIPTRRIRRFREWVNQISAAWDFPTPTIHAVTERTLSRNLNLYDPKRKGWPADYESILDSVSRLIRERWTEHIPYQRNFTFSSSSTIQPIKLQPEDFVYLQRATDVFILTRKIRSYEALEARKAGFRESEHMAYRRRIEFLKKKGVLSPPMGIGLRHIGLDASINIYIKSSKEENQRIFRALQLLPYLDAINFDDGNGAAVILLSKASAIAVKSNLEDFFESYGVNTEIAIKPTWQADSFRKHLTIAPTNYNFEKDTWIWTKDTLPLSTKIT